jgi:hypothetical protein
LNISLYTNICTHDLQIHLSGHFIIVKPATSCRGMAKFKVS